MTAGVSEALREARERIAEAWNLADFPDRMQQATDAAVAALKTMVRDAASIAGVPVMPSGWMFEGAHPVVCAGVPAFLVGMAFAPVASSSTGINPRAGERASAPACARPTAIRWPSVRRLTE